MIEFEPQGRIEFSTPDHVPPKNKNTTDRPGAAASAEVDPSHSSAPT